MRISAKAEYACLSLIELARPGSAGGYQLARGADQITVAVVIAVVDGESHVQRRGGSPAAEGLSDILKQAMAAERGILAETTLGHLADRIAPRDWVV